jgi:broad specificity phosphatase PhoE
MLCYGPAHVTTTVFLIRHGVTDWHRERKILGQRDIGLNADGILQAQAVMEALRGMDIGEVISSPLLRAVQTAEIIAGAFDTEIARDPRLADFRVGKWEGMSYDDVERSPEYQRFVADPLAEKIPGGEDLKQIRDRAVNAVEQALRDSPAGENLAIVTHAGIVRVVLAHYLGSPLAQYHRLRVSPGSVSILSFGPGRDAPRVLATNWRGQLKEVL